MDLAIRATFEITPGPHIREKRIREHGPLAASSNVPRVPLLSFVAFIREQLNTETAMPANANFTIRLEGSRFSRFTRYLHSRETSIGWHLVLSAIRFRVLPDSVCERCGWDNENDGPVEQTRPQYCRHSPTWQRDIPSATSNRCRLCLRAVNATPGTHGTHERWEVGCDYNDCRNAMREWIMGVGLPQALTATLRDTLVFRRNGNELWLSTNTLKKQSCSPSDH